MPIAAAGAPAGAVLAISNLLRRGAELNQVFNNARETYEGAQHVYVAASSGISAVTNALGIDPLGQPSPINPTVGRRERQFFTPDRPTSTTIVNATPNVLGKRLRRTSGNSSGFLGFHVSRPRRVRNNYHRRVYRLGRRRFFRRY